MNRAFKQGLLATFLSSRGFVPVAVMSFAMLTALAVSARNRLLLLFLAAFLVLAPAMSLSRHERYVLLLAAILLVLVQTPQLAIPYSFSISQLLLLLLAFIQLVEYDGLTTVSRLRYLPYILLAVAGLVNAVVHNEINYWHIVCLTPLLMMFLVDSLVETPEDSWRLLWVALATILGYLLVYWLAEVLGTVIEGYSGELASQYGWRLGARDVSLGPIQFVSYSVTLGTLVSLGVPLTTLLFLREGRATFIRRFFLGAVLILLLAVLALTSARTATVAAIVGIAVVLVVSGRLRSLYNLAIIAALALALLAWGQSLLNLVPPESLARFGEIRNDPRSVANFASRLDTLSFTVRNVSQNPFGFGFGYYWTAYGIDESIVYSALLNGIGLFGSALYLLIAGQLLQRFVSLSLQPSISDQQRDFVAIGLGTLTCGLVVGVGSESILLGPVQAIVFWTILAGCYQALRHSEIPKTETATEVIE